uniref:Uncharacterized protein n=1 Tax=Oryza brachyantha TaxID=4533 RepID=J3MME1_ORYBR
MVVEGATAERGQGVRLPLRRAGAHLSPFVLLLALTNQAGTVGLMRARHVRSPAGAGRWESFFPKAVDVATPLAAVALAAAVFVQQLWKWNYSIIRALAKPEPKLHHIVQRKE